MADTNAGIFIPNESDVLSAVQVLKGTVAVGPYITPTASDISESVLAPLVTEVSIKGDMELEIDSGYGATDLINFPASRPQVSDEIRNALAGGSFGIRMRGDVGINGKLYNCDLGPNNVQLGMTDGFYQDHRVRGSVVFHKNDPVLRGSNPDHSYYGKSRFPVHDFYDAIIFYDYAGVALNGDVSPNKISYPRLYSDDDFIYCVAQVKGAGTSMVCSYIGFFIYDAYDKVFRMRGIINSNNSVNDCRVLWLRSSQTIFTSAGMVGCIPASANICRVKNFKNKLICSYIQIDPIQASSVMHSMSLRIFDSYDDGYIWNEIAVIGQDYFQSRLIAGAYTIDDLRMRMASNGQDILLVWKSLPIVGSREYRQMHWLRSRDGGINWEYDISSNMAEMAVAHRRTDDILYPAYTPGTDCSVAFDLVVNSDGLFVLGMIGEGETAAATSNGIHGGQRHLIFYYAEGGDCLTWKRGASINIDNGYNLQIEGMEGASDLLGWNRHPIDIALVTDTMHGWDYALVKVKNEDYAVGDLYRNDYFTSMVRYKYISWTEWTTHPPSWGTDELLTVNCGDDHAFVMEPVNRNTAIYHGVNSVLDSFSHYSVIFYRGQFMTLAGMYYDNIYTSEWRWMMGQFRLWNNCPVNYSNRFTFLPMAGAPANYGFINTVNIAVTRILANYENRYTYSIAPATVYVGANWDYDEIVKAANCETPLSEDEYAVRFVIRRAVTFDAGLSITVMEIAGYHYDPAISQWRTNTVYVNLLAAAAGFEFVGLQVAAVVDATATADIWWEYMLIRRRREVLLMRRPFNNFTTLTIQVAAWDVIYQGNTATEGAGGALGNSYIRMGLVNCGLGNYVNGYTWDFKGVFSSRTKTDIYPSYLSYRQYYTGWVAPVLTPGTHPGVLSSEYKWDFPRYPNTDMTAMYNSIKGEFITPNPIWVGNEWLSVSDSNWGKQALMWLTLKENFALMPNQITRDIGLVKDRAILGNGVNPATYPTQLAPMGMTFDGANQYINCGADIRYTINSSITMAAWINPAAAATVGYVIARRRLAGGYSLYFAGAANTIEMYGGTVSPVTSSAVFTEYNQWIHVAITIDSAFNVRFYKNGEFVNVVNCTGLVSPAGLDLTIGCRSDISTYFTGGIGKPSLFNRVLDGGEIKKLYYEGKYGPMVPSDFFVRVFGMHGAWNDTWQLTERKYGSVVDNVVDGLPGTYYLSERDGKAGIVPGGASYSNGDVEVVLYHNLGGFITANAAVLINCDATDVAIYSKDASPLAGGWALGDQRAIAQFHYRDDDDNIKYLEFTAITNGIGTVSVGGPLRPGMLAGRKVILYDNPTRYSHYNVLNDPTLNKIQKIVYNDETVVQFDDKTLTMATVGCRLLSPNLLVTFAEQSNRYWRFILTNNAFNGSKIKIGGVLLGTYIAFDTNFDVPYTYSIEAQEESKVNEANSRLTSSYNRNKSIFNLSFAQINTSPSINNFSLIKQAFEFSVKFARGIFFALGFYSGEMFTPLVYKCAVEDNTLTLKSDIIPNRSLEVTLKEL